MNRPTPDPSEEGSRHWSASCQFPSWEGLGVGSWSQCMRKNERGLPMNLPTTNPPLTPTAVELRSADFSPPPLGTCKSAGSGMNSALQVPRNWLNSTAVPLTPPRRGTGQPVLLPSWEGLGAGSGAQCAQTVRSALSLCRRLAPVLLLTVL